MSTKLIHLKEWREKLRLETKRLSTEETRVKRQMEQLLDVIDELQGRVEDLERRQLQVVRALNELLSRLEVDE